MIGSSRSYAIGSAHFQTAGGWKSLLIVIAVYVFLVFAALGIFYYSESVSGYPRRGLTSDAITLLLALQTLVLTLFGTARVSGAVRSDLTSKMIESHRLMPVSSVDAVLGYLFGPTAHALAFFLINSVFAYIFAAVTGTSIAQVTIGQGVLLTFSLLLWSAAVASTFVARYIFFVGIGAAIFGGCTMGIYAAYSFFPALKILTTPLLGSSIYSFSGGTAVYSWVYGVSLMAQGAFFIVCFTGACRRYRGTFPTTLSIPAALLLVAAWSGATIGGLLDDDASGWAGRMHGERNFHTLQMVGSLAMGMLLAMVTVRTAVTLGKAPRQHAAMWGIVGVILTIAILCVIPIGAMAVPAAVPAAYPITVAVVAAHVATVGALFLLLHRVRTWVALVIVAVVCAVLWCGPLVLDLLVSMATTRPSRPPTEPAPTLGLVAGFSPIGELIKSWSEEAPGPILPGVIGQCVLAALMLAVALIVPLLWKRRPAVAVEPMRLAPGAEQVKHP